MEGDKSGFVGEGEFMESFDEGEDWHGEEKHFWIVEGAEELLKLDGGGEDKKIFFFD